jgi:hypothetical protein
VHARQHKQQPDSLEKHAGSQPCVGMPGCWCPDRIGQVPCRHPPTTQRAAAPPNFLSTR